LHCDDFKNKNVISNIHYFYLRFQLKKKKQFQVVWK